MSEKIYIGKGKQVKDYPMVQLSIKVSDVLKYAHEYKEETYLTFTVAQMREPDAYGKTHTAYITQLPEKKS